MAGAVSLPCWLVGLKCPGNGAYRLLSGARSCWENGGLQEGLCQWVLTRTAAASVLVPAVSHSHHPLPPASTGDPPILAGKSGPVSYEVTTFFPGSWCAWDPVCTLQEWSFGVPQACGTPAVKPHWSSKPDSLPAPPPIARPPGWGAWHGAQNFHSSGRTSIV